MVRPALSAARGIDILDILAAFPDRAFTFSEIARAAKINTASCHAILNVLVTAGYLSRSVNGRSYRLGRAALALGKAAIKAHPLASLAEPVIEELARELDLAVLLNTTAGDDIVCVLSCPDPAGRRGAMDVGERLPLVPPTGIPFLAWSPEEEIVAWIARAPVPQRDDLAEEWRHMLALTRERGFQVTLRTTNKATVSSMMSEMASRRGKIDYRDEITRYVSSLDGHMFQPEAIQLDELYEIALIASPLFDQTGQVAYNLCLSGFTEPLSGATIIAHSERLLHACLRVMQEDRARN
jgi:DNA-binding IclR family transcriptional regulator